MYGTLMELQTIKFMTLNNMLTCAIAYESNNYSNGEVGMLLINGFSRSLKLWWDHALTNEQKEVIKNHRTKVKRKIKVEE